MKLAIRKKDYLIAGIVCAGVAILWVTVGRYIEGLALLSLALAFTFLYTRKK